MSIPLGFGILAHAVSHRVHLLPALTPFVGIAFLGAHVDDLEVVAPLLCVPALVFDAVSLDGPFSGAFPIHHTTSDISCQHYNILLPSPQPGRPPIDGLQCWNTNQHGEAQGKQGPLDSRVTLNRITDTSSSNTISSRNFIRLMTFPRNVFNLSSLLPLLGYDRPRPSFSLSEKSRLPPILNLGKLLDILRACLLKKPVFCVENDGYPFTSSLFAFALAHVTFPLPLAAPAFV